MVDLGTELYAEIDDARDRDWAEVSISDVSDRFLLNLGYQLCYYSRYEDEVLAVPGV